MFGSGVLGPLGQLPEAGGTRELGWLARRGMAGWVLSGTEERAVSGTGQGAVGAAGAAVLVCGPGFLCKCLGISRRNWDERCCCYLVLFRSTEENGILKRPGIQLAFLAVRESRQWPDQPRRWAMPELGVGGRPPTGPLG